LATLLGFLFGELKMKSIPHSTPALVAQHQQTALIRRKEVERLTALSRSRIYALMASGQFPKPVALGAMSVAWLEIEIREWIASRIADRNSA
jgi:prophage regulatory protein